MENHTNNRPQNMTPGTQQSEEAFTTHLYGILIVKEGKHFFLVSERDSREQYHGQQRPNEDDVEIFAIAQ